MKNHSVADFFQRFNSRTISLITVTLAVLLLSCVSKKKYDLALEEIARLTVDSTFQEYDKADVAYTKDSVIYRQKSKILEQSYAIDSLDIE